MRYMLDLPEGLVDRIYREVGDRPGFNLRTFVLLAIENQLEMERTGEPIKENTDDSRWTGHRRDPTQDRIEASVPKLIQRTGSEGFTLEKLTREGRSDVVDDQDDAWVWGQVNRVFPLKFAIRALCTLSQKGPVPVEEARDRLGKAARSYGLALERSDKLEGRRRENRLSVGFPTGKSESDAVSRYRNQFVARIREDGRISGALATLGLIGLDSEQRIAPTGPAREFAAFTNTILDDQEFDHPTLTPEEIDFYLEHSLERAPSEGKAFACILEGLTRGATTNDELNEFISESVGSNWSESMVSTQRSGTMGRMLELGLLSRERDGRRVRYEPTEHGQSFHRRCREELEYWE